MGFRVYVKENSGDYYDVHGYNWEQEKLLRELYNLHDKYDKEFLFGVNDSGTEHYDIEIIEYKNFLHAVEKEYGLKNNDARNLTSFNNIRFGERFGIIDEEPLINTPDYKYDGILQIYYHWRDIPSAIADNYIKLESF